VTQNSPPDNPSYYDDSRKSCFYSKIFALVEDIAIFLSVAIEDCDMSIAALNNGRFKNNTDLPSGIVAPAAELHLPLFQSFLFGIRRNNEYFLVESKGPLYTDLEHPVASLEGPTIRFLEVLG